MTSNREIIFVVLIFWKYKYICSNCLEKIKSSVWSTGVPMKYRWSTDARQTPTFFRLCVGEHTLSLTVLSSHPPVLTPAAKTCFQLVSLLLLSSCLPLSSPFPPRSYLLLWKGKPRKKTPTSSWLKSLTCLTSSQSDCSRTPAPVTDKLTLAFLTSYVDVLLQTVKLATRTKTMIMNVFLSFCTDWNNCCKNFTIPSSHFLYHFLDKKKPETS